MKKKTKLSNLLNKNNLLLFLILLPFSLFSLDVKKNSDSPGSEITPSRVETNKAPLEIDEAEGIKDVEHSGDSSSKKKAKKHSLTPEQLKKKKEIIEKVLKFGSNKERKEAMRELSHLSTEGLGRIS
ncbi:MAG: hypothetical protein IPG24_17450 [Leptospiraceae bacterium]|nr:hypothetical protein [Leptospiraceae bacterium]